VTDVGRRLREGIAAAGHPLVSDVRGEGLLLAIILREPVAAALAARALEAGFIVNAVAPDAIRLAPPLILSAEQAADFVAFVAADGATTDASAGAR
jgi:acetylornithine/N-succinyldiaminopimelate aminotransferase